MRGRRTTGAFGGSALVAGLILDQQAALIAQGCLEAGSAKCTFGTGAFLLANTGSPVVHSTAGLATSLAWRTRRQVRHSIDGQIYTAAGAVEWLHELGLVSAAADLDRVAAAGDDNDDPICIPALAGLGVRGHEKIPIDGHGFSPTAAMRSPH
jgi:glycerol kinase